MKTKNLNKLSIAVLSALTIAACNGSFSTENQSTDSIAGQAASSNYTAGVPVTTSEVAGLTFTSTDGADLSPKLDQFLMTNPDVSLEVSELKAVTKVVTTQENNLELYAGEELVMALGQSAGQLNLLNARQDFKADSVTMSGSDLAFQLPGLRASLRLQAESEEQDQGQGQGQKQVQSQDDPIQSPSPSPSVSPSPSPSPTVTPSPEPSQAEVEL